MAQSDAPGTGSRTTSVLPSFNDLYLSYDPKPEPDVPEIASAAAASAAAVPHIQSGHAFSVAPQHVHPSQQAIVVAAPVAVPHIQLGPAFAASPPPVQPDSISHQQMSTNIAIMMMLQQQQQQQQQMQQQMQVRQLCVESTAGKSRKSKAPHQSGGSKQHRTTKTHEQAAALKYYYHVHSSSPDKEQLGRLAQQYGMSKLEVTRWFRNERYKMKSASIERYDALIKSGMLPEKAHDMLCKESATVSAAMRLTGQSQFVKPSLPPPPPPPYVSAQSRKRSRIESGSSGDDEVEDDGGEEACDVDEDTSIDSAPAASATQRSFSLDGLSLAQRIAAIDQVFDTINTPEEFMRIFQRFQNISLPVAPSPGAGQVSEVQIQPQTLHAPPLPAYGAVAQPPSSPGIMRLQ